MIDIVKIGSWLGGIGVVATAAYGVTDYTETRPIIKKEYVQFAQSIDKKYEALQLQLDQLSQTTLSIRFWNLQDKEKVNGTLTLDEQRDRCKLAKVLEYVVQGCPNG
jgi:hypothetical protein